MNELPRNPALAVAKLFRRYQNERMPRFLRAHETLTGTIRLVETSFRALARAYLPFARRLRPSRGARKAIRRQKARARRRA